MISSTQLKAPEALELHGRFITLVPLEAERDAGELFDISHGSEAIQALWRYLPLGPFACAADLEVFLRTWQSKPDVLPFTVKEASSGACLGTISLMEIRPEHGVAELGWIWYAPAAQGTKANTESSYLLLRYCFEELHYRRMEWKCNSRNERSRLAALRLGFSYEGLFRQHMILKGENRDTAWFSILDREWADRQAAMSRWLYTEDSPPLRELTAALGGKMGG